MSCPINQGLFPIKHSIYFPSINSHFPSSMVVIWHKINSFSNQYILVLYIRMVAIFHINPYSFSHQTWVFFHNVDWNHIWFSRTSAPLGRAACVAVFGAPASIQAEKKTYCLGKWLEPSWCLEKSHLLSHFRRFAGSFAWPSVSRWRMTAVFITMLASVFWL